MKILIIEDNKLLAKRVKDLLSENHLVDMVHTGVNGLNFALATQYEIIILDVGLPDLHGIKVCEELREQRVESAILVLSGINDTLSRVNLLNSGADDYLTKPFNGSELRARVAALARRQPNMLVNNVMVVGDLEVDIDKREVRKSGVLILLRRKEFDILQYLVKNQGRPVSREMILNHAWESDVENWNNTVDVHIKHLRDKIDRPFQSSLIKTAYGIGYMVENTQSK